MKAIYQFVYYYLIAHWLIIPLLTGLIVIIDSSMRQSKIKECGKLIIPLREKKKLGFPAKLSIVMMIISIILLISNLKETIACIAIFGVALVSFSNEYRIYRYSMINGVYEKGLILDGVYYWNKLHSWKDINNETISILDKSGSRFDLVDKYYHEKIIEQLLNNSVAKEIN